MNETEERGRGPDTRRKLIEVAADLFAERGYDGVSVRDIVRAAGANLGAVTYHFGGKERLFGAVMELKTEPLRKIFLECAQSDGPPREKLSDILHRAVLHILHDDPSLHAFFLEAVQGGDRLPQSSIEALKMRNKVVGGIIQDGIDQGLFRPCDVECATWVFFGMLMPYVMHHPLIVQGDRKKPYSKESVRSIVNTALDVFLLGLERRE